MTEAELLPGGEPVPRLGHRPGPLPGVLLVSPPVAPPWLNGTSVLVRDLARTGSAFRYHVMGYQGQRSPGGRATVVPVYGAAGSARATSLGRLVARLLRPLDGCAIHHFFFAPHPRAVRVARILTSLRRKRTVHTIPSKPAEGSDLAELVFAHRTVVMTEATALHFRSAGAHEVHVIRPAVALPPEPADPEVAVERLALAGMTLPEPADGPLFVYPGDLSFSDGARVTVEAAVELARRVPEARVVLACRSKTPTAATVQSELKRRLEAAGVAGRVGFAGVVPDMPALLGAATAVVLPVDTLYAKVDTPIVVLEAMALGTPAIVSDLPPLVELAGLGEGVRVVPRSDPGALADAMATLAESPTLAGRLGAGARRTVASHFRPDAMAGAYEALYRELLDA